MDGCEGERGWQGVGEREAGGRNNVSFDYPSSVDAGGFVRARTHPHIGGLLRNK